MQWALVSTGDMWLHMDVLLVFMTFPVEEYQRIYYFQTQFCTAALELFFFVKLLGHPVCLN
jgi:hypothetical protein